MAGRTDEELNGVTLLGNQGTKYLFEYTPDVLEAFDNKHPNRDYFVKFNFPEFTSLCPKAASLILPPFISATFLIKKWWRASR